MFVPFVFPCELLIDYLLQVLLMDRKKDFSLCCELKTFFFHFLIWLPILIMTCYDLNVFSQEASVENLMYSVGGGANEKWLGHEGSDWINAIVRSRFIISGVSSLWKGEFIHPLFLWNFLFLPPCPSTMWCLLPRLRRPSPDIGNLILGFPACRTVIQWNSVHYMLPNLWHSVIAAQHALMFLITQNLFS